MTRSDRSFVLLVTFGVLSFVVQVFAGVLIRL